MALARGLHLFSPRPISYNPNQSCALAYLLPWRSPMVHLKIYIYPLEDLLKYFSTIPFARS